MLEAPCGGNEAAGQQLHRSWGRYVGGALGAVQLLVLAGCQMQLLVLR
jgi:hypothetical protein